MQLSSDLTEHPSSSTAEQARTIRPVTRAGKIHHHAAEETLNLFFLIGRSIGEMDEVVASLVEENPEQAEEIGPIPGSQRGPHGGLLRKYSQPLLQMLICRLVDNFLTYLSEVIREILYAKPEMLRSGELVRVDYLLQFSSIEELTADLIDRKVADLSYRSFAELEKWFADRIGVPLADQDHARNDLIELIETRNIFVHNRGVIGPKYLRNVIRSRFDLGDQRTVDLDYLVHAVTILLGTGDGLDEVLGAKYSLSNVAAS